MSKINPSRLEAVRVLIHSMLMP